MPPDPVNHDQLDHAIDRAFQGFEKLLRAELRTIGVELRAINQRLSRVDQIEGQIDGLDTRMTAMEAFKNAHEHRLGTLEQGTRDWRAWWREHFPSLILSAVSLGLGAIALFH